MIEMEIEDRDDFDELMAQAFREIYCQHGMLDPVDDNMSASDLEKQFSLELPTGHPRNK